MGEKGNVVAGSEGLVDQALDAGKESVGFVTGAVGQGVSGVIVTKTQEKLTAGDEEDDVTGRDDATNE